MAKMALEGTIVNAPYFDRNQHRDRERRYPFLAVLDLLLGWSIGLATLAVGLYAFGLIFSALWPFVATWLRLMRLY